MITERGLTTTANTYENSSRVTIRVPDDKNHGYNLSSGTRIVALQMTGSQWTWVTTTPLTLSSHCNIEIGNVLEEAGLGMIIERGLTTTVELEQSDDPSP
jgi:hypothetical protein